MHAGYRASGTDTKVELTNCSTSGDLRGCEASSKGSMHATTVAVTGSIQEGFAVFSHAELDGCTVKDCGLQVWQLLSVDRRFFVVSFFQVVHRKKRTTVQSFKRNSATLP